MAKTKKEKIEVNCPKCGKRCFVKLVKDGFQCNMCSDCLNKEYNKMFVQSGIYTQEEIGR